MIGAVVLCPTANKPGWKNTEHRESWDGMRLAESMVDSTPFLEGSCMMWRPSCLAIDDLNVGSNADDAQIATSVHARGWRTVVDTRARFVDAAPASIEEQTPKVLRAQGLQRLLIQRRKRATARTQGMFAENHAPSIPFPHHRHRWHWPLRVHQRHHALGVHCAVRMASHVHARQQPSSWIHGSRDLVCGLVVAQSERENNGPLIARSMAFKHGVAGPFVAHHARGTSLHMWEQHTDVRDAVVELEV